MTSRYPNVVVFCAKCGGGVQNASINHADGKYHLTVTCHGAHDQTSVPEEWWSGPGEFRVWAFKLPAGAKYHDMHRQAEQGRREHWERTNNRPW